MAKYIPEQHFKGIREIVDGSCPLAFITPYGTDKPAKQRMETVRCWSNEDSTEIIDNVPLNGFKISREIRRWSTSNVVWRIEDPRGFELEISSGNMAYLLSECVFNHGVIEDDLIWCRDGAQNFLLPVKSDEYADYELHTQCIKAGLKIKDINIGDHIRLASGESGKYLGGYHLIQNDTDYSYNMIIYSTRKYILLTEDGDYVMKSLLKDIQLIKKGIEEDNRNWENDIKIPFTYVSKKKKNIDNVLETIKIINVDGIIGNTDIFEYKSDYYQYMKNSYYKFRRIIFNIEKNSYTDHYVNYYHKSGLSSELEMKIWTKDGVQKKKVFVLIDGEELQLKL